MEGWMGRQYTRETLVLTDFHPNLTQDMLAGSQTAAAEVCFNSDVMRGMVVELLDACSEVVEEFTARAYPVRISRA
ncbi:hypothetical protein RRG08_059733 [Elysia crispata]|uniref:Uncharacterized protein n=1 Tax=Elysia crispata TaxID=231223 RepID=A0AAE1D2D1_9GAST|nr:hypothetical protein RRG08_059733 [Elysia crispata]